ncbi:MAG: PAS domain S-box protein [Chloroflexi bacterium]|nr:PAS domain S-box protein [Chloroflexota bacterium]
MTDKKKQKNGENSTRNLGTEEAMKFSLSLLSASLESTADGILIVDRQGKIALWNQKFANMWKIPEEVLSTRDDEKAINHILTQLADPEQFVAKVRKLYEQPEQSSFDQVEFLDGRVFERYSQPQRIEGDIVGRVWSFRDITERKRVEEELRESEQKYRAAVETASDVICIIQDGIIRFSNPRVTTMFGYKPEEIEGKNIASFIPQENLGLILERYRKRMAGEKLSEVYETALLHKSGRKVDIELSGSVIRYEGNPADLVIIRDITERKRADEALARSEERYRTILENMQDVYIEVDLVGNFTFVNEAAGLNLAYSKEQLIGSNFSDITSDQDELKAVFKAYNEVYKTGEPNKGFAFKIVRKDGTTGYGETSISLIKDEQGKPIGFRSVGRDVTERKKMEVELQRLASVVHNSSELVNLSTIEGKMIFLNAAGAKMLGIDPQKVDRFNIMQVIPAHLVEKVQSELLPQLLKGGNWEGDLQYLNLKTGLLTDVHATTFAIKDPSSGTALYFANVSLDITERKQTEESILRSKLLLQSVIDSTPDWMYVKDLRHKFLLVNRSFAEAQNAKPQDMVDRPDTDFFSQELCTGNPDKGIRGFHADDNQAFGGQTVHNPKNIITWADGSMHIYDTYKIPLADQSGKIYAALVYSRDITGQRKAEDEREASFKTLQKTLHDIINTMSKIVEMRDPYTSGHQGRVAELSGAIAREMKLDDSRIEHLMMAASIHDVGKMYVPADILSKPGKLSDIEWAMIKSHVEGSYEILKDLEFSQPIALMALQHHERLDGSGYPNGLKGEEILLEAKILAVADVVEAMSSHRPYRPALGAGRAFEEISNGKGKLYDPEVVDACLELFNSGRFEFKHV